MNQEIANFQAFIAQRSELVNASKNQTRTIMFNEYAKIDAEDGISESFRLENRTIPFDGDLPEEFLDDNGKLADLHGRRTEPREQWRHTDPDAMKKFYAEQQRVRDFELSTDVVTSMSRDWGVDPKLRDLYSIDLVVRQR